VTESSKSSQLSHLTITRFFAACSILIFHFGSDMPSYQRLPFELFFGSLNFSVSYFFVLSGFILYFVYSQKKKLQVKQFFVNRVARIYPIYVLAWLLLSAWAYFHFELLTPALQNHFWSSFLAGLLLLQAWLGSRAQDINFVAWSLSVEAFFYSIFPFILPFFMKKSLKVLSAITFGLWLLTQVMYICFKENNEFIDWFPLMHVSSFVIGVYIGRLYFTLRKIKINWAVIVLISIILKIVLNLIPLTREYGHDGLLSPLTGFFIISFALLEGRIVEFLSKPIFIFLGDISYGVYIMQYVGLYAFYRLTRPDFFWSMDWARNSFLVVYVGLCALLFVYVETPAREYLRKFA
jgi:peptidoglycan/LPS O-acetylase OafA/YrhL